MIYYILFENSMHLSYSSLYPKFYISIIYFPFFIFPIIFNFINSLKILFMLYVDNSKFSAKATIFFG